MVAVARIIHGTAKHIENAPIYLGATKSTQLHIEILWVRGAKCFHVLDAEIEEILGDAGPDTRDLL